MFHKKKKILIFHLGCGSGFYSEYDNMLFAYVYCLMHNIEFKLYSADANFKIKKGYSDYFINFCEEVFDDFHSYLNRRQKFPMLTKLYLKKLLYKQPIPSWVFDKFKPYMLKQYIIEPIYKKKYKFDYYTFELWNKFKSVNPYYHDILYKTLKLNNKELTFKQLYEEIISLTYKFNNTTKKEIESFISTLNLPTFYIGMHIRAGDKIKEDKVYDIKNYFDLLRTLSNETSCDNIYVFTDDYSIIKNIKEKYPTYKIFTLCETNEQGYDNLLFNQLKPSEKKEKIIKMFANVEILTKSNIFIGAYNSSPDIFLSLRRKNNSYFIDRKISNY
ncbi:MAG: hypothetical protein GYA62_13525 [Bacteroidales bacterium]|nr:hypothetical protein [Bacteroidales bacterium]